MPKVSIIVPVYKAEKYLNRCIDSIIAQTFIDWELLLIDDGSPDRSGKICDEYAQKDKRIQVIHKPNGGVSSARNNALELVKSDWRTGFNGLAPASVSVAIENSCSQQLITAKIFPSFSR